MFFHEMKSYDIYVNESGETYHKKTETQKNGNTKTGAIKALIQLLRYQTCFLLPLQY